MSRRGRGRGWARALGLRRACLLFVGVGVTTSYLGLKVELANVARRAERCQQQIATLKEERARLSAAVVFRQKPGAIENVARGQLEMEYPAGRPSELSFHTDEVEEIE
ncbi:MAG: hypothetical protein AB1505_00830 [Candidatus Latescibacterota bacterium]